MQKYPPELNKSKYNPENSQETANEKPKDNTNINSNKHDSSSGI